MRSGSALLPVGEVNVTDAMNASGAFLGTEGSSGRHHLSENQHVP